jgi:hypothetical protein
LVYPTDIGCVLKLPMILKSQSVLLAPYLKRSNLGLNIRPNQALKRDRAGRAIFAILLQTKLRASGECYLKIRPAS